MSITGHVPYAGAPFGVLPAPAPLAQQQAVSSSANSGEYEKKIAIGLLSAAAATFVVAPLALEALEMRGSAQKTLQRERFEQSIQNARCSGKDVALEWVRDRDRQHIDPVVVNAVAKHMHAAWAEFEKADKACEGSSDNALLQRRAKALQKVRELQLPLREEPGGKISLDHRPVQAQTAIDIDAETRLATIYHLKLGELADAGYKDGDTSRLAQAQCEWLMQRSLGVGQTKAAALAEKHSLGAGRELEFSTKLAKLHQQAVGECLGMVKTGRTTPPPMEQAPSVILRRTGNTPPSLGFASEGDIRFPDPAEVKRVDAVMAKVQTLRSGLAEELASKKSVDLSRGFLHLVGLTKNLADETFKVPTSPDEIKQLLAGWRKETTGENPRYLFTMCMSLRDLEYPHLGIGDHAPHLHPNHAGMTTGSPDDRRQARVVWEFPAPKSGELHPIDVRMAEGKLLGAWLTKDERGCEAEVKAMERASSRVAEALGGNRAALKSSLSKRIAGGMRWRYSSLFRGMKEGSSNPRNMGRIAAVVLLFSSVVSMTIYGIIDAVHYHVLTDETKKRHTPSPQQQIAPAATTQPLMLESASNGNASLSLTA